MTDAVRADVDVALAIRGGEGVTSDELRRLLISSMESRAARCPFLYVYIQESLSHIGGTRADWSREMRQLNKAYEDGLVSIIQAGIGESTIRPVGEPG
ncbi:hypothetical protein DQ238_09805 [Geodermatophilus sp. TF02-6]|uniref:hypothetical protein n=1 Tax=Geodermatophilus sp. TF02-6 TaxID=2250575 RepID=UPI000DE80230|nr:hypothetical protein [Geodermatophilus sp. TF02-6]RBY79903.1 hypothetical protein DQ238_09805 [Geodermatophilus sp. TF02-6]